MRLTIALLKRKMPNGYIWTGKNRFGHNVYPETIQRMVKRLQIEERNMYLLRHPYLTFEEERGHTVALGKHEKWLDKVKLQTAAQKVVKSTTFEDKLGHLYNSNKWEL